MYKLLIVVCLAALALADEKVYGGKSDGYDAKDDHYVADKKSGYGGHPGYHHGFDGHYYGGYGANKHREAHVNYYNGLRQHAVNAAAKHQGAGIGTAGVYGVPGTPVGVHNHVYDYGYHGYPYYGYGNHYGHGYYY